MLRDIAVSLVLIAGLIACVRGPFNALLLYVWVAYFRPEQWVWSSWVGQSRLSIVVGTILILLTLVSLTPERLRFTFDTALLALFFLQALLSMIFSQDPEWSQHWWIEFAKVMIVGYLIVVHVDSVKRLRTLLVVMSLSLGLEAAKQGWLHMLLNPGLANTNGHPALGDNNGVAIGMFMLTPIVGVLAYTAGRHWQRWFWWALTAGVAFRGVTTYSRGGLLAAAALALTFAWGSRHRLGALIATVLVAATVYAVMPEQFWQRMETISISEEEQDASMRGRLHFWRMAGRMTADYPLLGVGFNAYSRVYDRYDVSFGAFGHGRAVHSAWLGVLSELGWPGFVLILTIVLRSMWNSWRVRTALREVADPDSAALSQYAHGLQSALLVYAVGGVFFQAQYSELFWHIVWIGIAVSVLARTAVPHSLRRIATTPRTLPISAFAGAR